MTSTLPVPDPVRTPEVEPFWEGAARGRLVLPRCRACHRFLWYPRTWCSACATADVDWVEASGRGTIYTFTVVRRSAAPGYADHLPYVLAYVQLAEGPRVLTNIRTCNPESLHVGKQVRAVFDAVGETALPRFEVAGGSDG
jgi:uncharacterized OB-fold protein